MRLIIVRHAIAMDRAEYQARAHAENGERSEVAASDDFRPVTEAGARKMKKNAKGLRELIGKPNLLVTSPLTRALQTTEILQSVWDGMESVICDELRPGSDPAALARWLNTFPQTKSPKATIVVVGHEPHLSSFASWLMTGALKSLLELRKGGACCIQFRSNTVASHRGRLNWLLTPNQLRAMR